MGVCLCAYPNLQSEDQNGTTTQRNSLNSQICTRSSWRRPLPRRTRANGRCRLPVQDPATGLCFKHAAPETSAANSAADRADLSADLFGEVAPTFQSAEEINATLAHLVVLVAQGRISSRRAAVITYALSLILRGVLVIDKKAAGRPFPT